MLKTNIHNSLTKQLHQEWEKLWKKSQYVNISNSPCWFNSAVAAFKYKDVKIISVHETKTSELVAIAAFVKAKIFSVSLYMTPAREFADKSQILADFNNKKVISALFKGILELGDVYLSNMTDYKLGKIAPLIKHPVIIKDDIEPYLDLSKGKYGDLPNRKKTIVLNRMKNSGRKFEIVPNAPDLHKALEIAFDIDTKSVKNRKGKGVFHDPQVREFYRQIAARNPSNIIVSLIYIDKIPVSYLIGFINNSVHSGSQKAYLPGYEYFVLGRLLLIHLMDHFREKGSNEFDLGKGYDRFKRDFTHNYWQYYAVLITSNQFLRAYISFLNIVNERIYPSISSHPIIYKTYKKIKTLFISFLTYQNKNS